MLFRLAADALLLLHLGFILFVALGALPALRWRRLVFVHLPVLAYGLGIELIGWMCPLTPLEATLHDRALAAGVGLNGFSRFIEALIYPAGLTREFQFLLAALLLVGNLALYLHLLRHR